MATKGTKVPSVYKVPTKADPELKLFAESIKEAVEVRLGRRGDPRDRAITLRELIDSGMAQELLDNPFDPNAGIGGIDFRGTQGYTDFTIPPTPTGFSVTASYTSFILAWDNPQMTNFGNTEVWRSTTSSIGDAIKVDTTSAFVWSEEVGYAKTYYYWVRHVSNSEVFGAYSSSGNGTTSIDIAAVMSNLTQTLADLPGYSTLTSLISSSTGTAATVIKSASAPTQRASGDALTTNDIWYDTDDGQVYTRNAANNAWVAARDATLVNIVGSTSYTGSSLTAALASAQSDVVTLTSANSSRVSEITNLTATVDTKAKTFVQTSAPTATAVGDIWIDSDDNNKMYRASAVGSSNWVAVRDTANDNYPRVFTQASAPTAVNTGDLWFDSDDDNKQYRWNGSSWVEVRDITTQAAVATEATARATADTANATLITNLTSTVDTKTQTFVQNSAPTAIAVGDLWIDANDNNKLYRASAVGASNWVAVRDTLNDNYPRVFSQNSEPTAVNTGDLWFDTNDSNKQYRWDGSNWVAVRDVISQAAITSEASTRATNDAANATAITTLETSTNNALTGKASTASVTAVQNAVTNGTSSQAGYGVAVNANGAVAGMYLMADSSNNLSNNTSTSNIIFEASQVTIRNPNAGGSDIVPFTVLTSTDAAGNPAGVYIDQAFIKAASITSAQIGSLSANLVNAVAINAGSISTGTLNAARVATNSLDIAGKSIVDSIGRIDGIAGQSGSVSNVTELNRGSFAQKPFHICTIASTAGNPDHVLNEVLSSPLFTHQFTTFNYSGNRKFIIQAGVDYEGTISSSSESLFVMSMRQTSNTSAYTSTTAGDYLASERFSGSSSFAIGIKNLNAQVSLPGNTTFTIWCFGKTDDVSGSSAGNFEGGYIQVFGLNK